MNFGIFEIWAASDAFYGREYDAEDDLGLPVIQYAAEWEGYFSPATPLYAAAPPSPSPPYSDGTDPAEELYWNPGETAKHPIDLTDDDGEEPERKKSKK